jgi:hypothetical protein
MDAEDDAEIEALDDSKRSGQTTLAAVPDDNPVIADEPDE